jgi:hypothetical protein
MEIFAVLCSTTYCIVQVGLATDRSDSGMR